MANKRITDVDYIESLNSDESFFVNQNNALKQVNKNNIIFNVANGGTGATTVEEAHKNLGITAIATTMNDNITMVDNKWSGCWIEFKDEEGNKTDEPYIHWYTNE